MIRTFTTAKPVDLQATKADLDYVVSELATKAPIANPTFTGYGRFADNLIAGDPGTEGTSIAIGGTAYESTFKVSDIDGTKYAQTILHRHSTTLEPLIVGARSNSNTSAHAAVTTGQGLFSIYAAGSVEATADYELFGAMSFTVGTGTVGATSAPGKWMVSVTPDGGVVPLAAITVDSDRSALFAGKVTTPAATAARASINAPHGTAPSAPVNGDVWSTTLGMYAQIDGVTQLLATLAAVGVNPYMRAFAAAHG